jgi:transketolase
MSETLYAEVAVNVPQVSGVFHYHLPPELAGQVGPGSLVARCLKAADELARQGIHARVIAIHTIKPLDADLLAQAAEETGALVTAEEHSILGGLGGAVAEALGRCRPVPIEYVGLNDTFAETGPDPDTLMDAWGMSVADVVAAAQRVLRRKR